MNLVWTITDLADQAVMLPLAVLVGLAMLAAGWRRGAIAWACVIPSMLAVMVVLKLWASTCSPVVFGDEVQSPSGHTAAAASIYGGVLTLLLRRTVRRIPIGFVCAGVVAVLIGATRVLIGAHSVLEVSIGAFVGVVAAMILERAAGPVPRTIPAMPVGLGIMAVILLFHGFRLPAEAAIHRTRIDWLPFGLCRANDAQASAIVLPLKFGLPQGITPLAQGPANLG